MTIIYPMQTDLNAHHYRRFSDQLDRTAATVTANLIGHRIARLIERHATPTQLIAELRHTADQLEQTGIR